MAKSVFFNPEFGKRKYTREELAAGMAPGNRGAAVTMMLGNAIFDERERQAAAARVAGLRAQEPFFVALGAAQRTAAAQQQLASSTAGQEAASAPAEEVQVSTGGTGAATASRRRRASGGSSSIRI